VLESDEATLRREGPSPENLASSPRKSWFPRHYPAALKNRMATP
jgi:hypothetical protein